MIRLSFGLWQSIVNHFHVHSHKGEGDPQALALRE